MNAEVSAPADVLEVDAAHALRVSRWIGHCGGVAVWGCLDLSQPGRQFFTPAKLTDGSQSPPPHWSAPRTPERVIIDAAEVEVIERREVKRFRIATQRGYGLAFRLTDASTAKLQRALAEAGDGATYVFEGDIAIVYGVVHCWPLREWIDAHPNAQAV